MTPQEGNDAPQNAAPGAKRQVDVLDPARANALWATLDRPHLVEAGDPLPPFFHQIYFWDPKAPPHLGRDGHPRVGGLIPDMGLPRRMWAGGELTFHTPLKVGREADKRTSVASVARKEGRSGPLAFVTLQHEVWQAGTLCVTELQNLVYREDPQPGAPQPAAPTQDRAAEDSERVEFSSTDLFRYSALTFNGHRIHYDMDYARDVEGYAHLVVHGPLLAQLLMLKAESDLGALARFSFRGTAALTLGRSAWLCRSGTSLWVESEGRTLHMTAEATPL